MTSTSRIWIMQQAPAGNWVGITSGGSWSSPTDKDVLSSLAHYRKTQPGTRFAVGVITETVFGEA